MAVGSIALIEFAKNVALQELFIKVTVVFRNGAYPVDHPLNQS